MNYGKIFTRFQVIFWEKCVFQGILIGAGDLSRRARGATAVAEVPPSSLVACVQESLADIFEVVFAIDRQEIRHAFEIVVAAMEEISL